MTEWDQPLQELPWHVMAYEEVLQHFKTNRNGLTEAEAKKRLEIYGPNQLREGKQISPCCFAIDN